MAVSNKAGCYTGSPCAHFSAVAVHGVKQRLFFIIVFIWLRYHKGTTVAERIKMPDTAAVTGTEPVHPAKNAGFEGYPLRNSAKVLRSEIDTIFIGNLRTGHGDIFHYFSLLIS